MKKKIFTTIVVLLSLVLGAQAQNKVNGHEYVDLGLPSGTIWATENVSIDRVEYMNLGEPETYEFGWGDEWTFPTYSQLEELSKNCTKQTDDKYITFVSRSNGNTVRFPIEPYAKNTSYEIWCDQNRFAHFSYMGDNIVGSDWYLMSSSSSASFPMAIWPVLSSEAIKIISDIPDGWKVNGKTPVDGKVTVLNDQPITVTPGNVPPGKKIKSIKFVPAE